MFDDLDPPPKKKAYEIGMALDDHSIDELQDVIAELKDDIARIEAAITKKKASSEAAENFFK